MTLIVHRCQIDGCHHPDWWAANGRAAGPARGGLPTAPAFARKTCDDNQRPCHPGRRCQWGPPELQNEWRSVDNTPHTVIRRPGERVNRLAAAFQTCDCDDCRRFYTQQTGQPWDTDPSAEPIPF